MVDLNALGPFLDAKRRAVERIAGVIISPDEFRGKRTFENGQKFPRADGVGLASVTQEQYSKAMEQVYSDGNVLEKVTLYPEVAPILQRFLDQGYLVTLVSGVSSLAREKLWAWVQRHRLPVTDVVDLSGDTSPKRRAGWYIEGMPQVAVDTRADELSPVCQRLPRVRGVLMKPPSVPLPPDLPSNVSVVSGWNQVLEASMLAA